MLPPYHGEGGASRAHNIEGDPNAARAVLLYLCGDARAHNVGGAPVAAAAATPCRFARIWSVFMAGAGWIAGYRPKQGHIEHIRGTSQPRMRKNAPISSNPDPDQGPPHAGPARPAAGAPQLLCRRGPKD